jgi:hypothetical protein
MQKILIFFLFFSEVLFAQNFRDSIVTFQDIPWNSTMAYVDSVFSSHQLSRWHNNHHAVWGNDYLSFVGGYFGGYNVKGWHFVFVRHHFAFVIIYLENNEDATSIVADIGKKYYNKKIDVVQEDKTLKITWYFKTSKIIVETNPKELNSGDPVIIYANINLAKEFEQNTNKQSLSDF